MPCLLAIALSPPSTPPHPTPPPPPTHRPHIMLRNLAPGFATACAPCLASPRLAQEGMPCYSHAADPTTHLGKMSDDQGDVPLATASTRDVKPKASPAHFQPSLSSPADAEGKAVFGPCVCRARCLLLCVGHAACCCCCVCSQPQALIARRIIGTAWTTCLPTVTA